MSDGFERVVVDGLVGDRDMRRSHWRKMLLVPETMASVPEKMLVPERMALVQGELPVLAHPPTMLHQLERRAKRRLCKLAGRLSAQVVRQRMRKRHQLQSPSLPVSLCL